MTDVGIAIRSWRQQRGRTLRDLAAATSVDYTYLSKIEHGHDRPSGALVQRLDDALGAAGQISGPFRAGPCPRCGRVDAA